MQGKEEEGQGRGGSLHFVPSTLRGPFCVLDRYELFPRRRTFGGVLVCVSLLREVELKPTERVRLHLA